MLTPSWRTVVRHPLAGVRRECALACEDQVENCTVLYCTVYCTVLYCTVLYCTALQVAAWLETEQQRPNIVITDFVADTVITRIIAKNYDGTNGTLQNLQDKGL